MFNSVKNIFIKIINLRVEKDSSGTTFVYLRWTRKKVKFTKSDVMISVCYGTKKCQFWTFYETIIIYRIEKISISILTVRHGKQILPVEEIEKIQA